MLEGKEKKEKAKHNKDKAGTALVKGFLSWENTIKETMFLSIRWASLKVN